MRHDVPRTGKEIADYNLRGKVPTVINAPETPLLKLIKRIPRSMWSHFGSVKLSPKMGFNSVTSFHSLSQLAMWLGDNKKLKNSERMPYMSYINSSTNKVSLDTLLAHTSKRPSEQLINELKLNYKL